jgi:hypothetical protein
MFSKKVENESVKIHAQNGKARRNVYRNALPQNETTKKLF